MTDANRAGAGRLLHKRYEGMHEMRSSYAIFGEGFDPDLIKVMTSAFDDCRKLIPPTMHRATMEELMAKYIIAQVRQGTRDPTQLCAEAKKRLGIG